MDNPKHLLLSTESFTVPAEGCTTVSTEMAATSTNASPATTATARLDERPRMASG